MNILIKNYAIILTAFIVTFAISSCNISTKESKSSRTISVIKSSHIKVSEPSGLALSFDGNYFWTVSDNNSKVYKTNLEGKIIKSFVINGEDLEGIAVIDSVKLAVVLERTREVVVVDTSGNEIFRKSLNLKGQPNEGLEGICFDNYLQKFYLVNEKSPGLLIELNSSFDEVFVKDLRLARDYSDIYFAKQDSTLWILSDESKKIVQTDRTGKKIKEYKIDVEQPEGLVVDYARKKIFVVSDKKEELYEFNLP